MRKLLPILSVATLAACQPPVPDSRVQGGVGFDSYPEYQARVEAQRQTAVAGLPPRVNSYPQPGTPGMVIAAPNTAGTGPISATELQAAGIPVQPAAAAPVAQTQVAAAAPVLPAATDHAGISDEQDFDAVASRETIESDKQRIESNRAQYQQVAPTALPQRPGDTAAEVVEYAVNARNRLGESIYSRSRIALVSTERACARYPSPTAAQEAFLRSGGPKRDPKNLDPDGDGFACGFDPTPFQQARG